MRRVSRSKSYLFVKIVLAISVFVFVSCFGFVYQKTQADGGTWNRLTDLATTDTQIPRIVEFNGKLYAAVLNGTFANPKILVSDTNGENWDESDNFATALFSKVNGGIFYTEIAVYNDNLYVVVSGTSEGSLAVVLKSSNGTDWSAETPDELQSFDRITNLQVFAGNLYLSCYISDVGVTVIKMNSDENYTTSAAPAVFGELALYSLTSQVFDDRMYIGVSNVAGSEAWYTADGTTWQQTTGTIGNPLSNAIVQSSFVLDDDLYFVTRHFIGDAATYVFESTDGENWTDVGQSGLPTDYSSSPFSWYGSQAAVAGGKVYLPVSDGTLGAGIYSSSDGIAWTLEPTYTPDPDNDFLQSESMVLFKNQLYTAIDRIPALQLNQRNFLQIDRAYAAGVTDGGAFIMRSPVIAEPQSSQVSITPNSLPDGTVSRDYCVTLSANGGTAPYHFTLSQGPLPNGLPLSSNGEICGVPSQAGVFVLTISVIDSSNPQLSATTVLSLRINPLSELPKTGIHSF